MWIILSVAQKKKNKTTFRARSAKQQVRDPRVYLDQLLDMKQNPLQEPLICGTGRKPVALIKKRQQENAPPNRHRQDPSAKHDHRFGKAFNHVEVKPGMIGHYLEELPAG